MRVGGETCHCCKYCKYWQMKFLKSRIDVADLGVCVNKQVPFEINESLTVVFYLACLKNKC